MNVNSSSLTKGSFQRTTAMNRGIQNTLKKLKLLGSESTISSSQVKKTHNPKSILKKSEIPSENPKAQNLNTEVHIINIKHKLFSPQSLTIGKGDSIEFVIDAADSLSNNYVL